MSALPVDDVLPTLRGALGDGRDVVLQAPPGAGKTTRVPLVLLDESWLAGGRIVLLEPRRLAARAAAAHMARQLGQNVGDAVGYRIRLDTRVGPNTRVEVVTEGVLTRMLLDDPALEGVGVVIFDEFHERNLHADLGLALTLHARKLFRPDLRVIVMSATLQTEALAAVLGDAIVLTGQARAYPVETRYLDRRGDRNLDAWVVRAVHEALEHDSGDLLVFLPGSGEIRRIAEKIGNLGSRVVVAPLYGDLTQAAQDRAIAPSPPGRRKVVLSTSIAETSLTIEGVHVVIDGGLMRVPRFSPRTGLSHLRTVRVTRASADQRCGRAGRLGPGVCYRLWTEADHATLAPHGVPEILEADLTPLALDLAAWGVTDPDELSWVDRPREAAYAQARELLRELGALDAAGAITEHGRRLSRLPVHPRLAHMLLEAKRLGMAQLGCEISALLGERDILRGEGPPDVDIRSRIDVLRRGSRHVEDGARRRALAEARELERRLGTSSRRAHGSADVHDAGLLLAFAYPDRIAHRRRGGRGRFLLRSGGGAFVDEADPLAAEDYIVAAAVDARRPDGRIFLGAALPRSDIDAYFAHQLEAEEVIEWDAATRRVIAARRLRLGAIILDEKPLRAPDPSAVTEALLTGIRREGITTLPWTTEARRLQQRLAFLHTVDPETWGDVSDDALTDRMQDWLAPYVYGLRSLDDAARLDVGQLIRASIPRSRMQTLDELAPDALTVPSGSRLPIDYTDPHAPAVAVRLQEVFGLLETPRIAGGRVPLTFRLLSPAHRPVQITRDLASFWRSGYFDVRRDLKGRYPKHYWPEDPLTATAVRGTRPRG